MPLRTTTIWSSAFVFLAFMPGTASAQQSHLDSLLLEQCSQGNPSAQQKAKSIRELLKALSSNNEQEELAAQRALVARGKEVMPELLKRLESGMKITRPYFDLLKALGPEAEAALPVLTARLGKKDEALATGMLMEQLKPGTLVALPEATKQKMALAVYEAVTDPKTDEMGFSALLLLNIGKSGTPIILRLLQHKDPEYRALAAGDLALARDPAITSDERIQAELVKLARNDPDGWVRAMAARALGSVGQRSQKAKAALLALLKDYPPWDGSEKDDKKRAETYARGQAAEHAARSLAKFGPGVIDDLIPLLSPIDAPSRGPAITALQDMGEPAVPRLVELLGHMDPTVAISASVALNQIGPPAVPALAKALKSKNEQVIENAASALWWIGPAAKAAVADLLEVAGSDRHSDVSRATAAHAALKHDPASRNSQAILSTVPLLLRMLEKGKSQHIVIETLGAIGAPARDALPLLRKLSRFPYAGPAISAIEADLAAAKKP